MFRFNTRFERDEWSRAVEPVWLAGSFLCTFSRTRVPFESVADFTLRILQISSAQTLGGGERHLADLARSLSSRDHEIHLALRPKSSLKAELAFLPPASIHTLTLRNALDAGSARELARLVRKQGIQIVHAHMGRDYPLAAYAARKNSGAKLVVTRHVLFPMNRLHRVTLSGAARIIAVSKAVAARLEADGIGDANKIRVVLNGIDVARFQDERAQFDRRKFLADWQLPDHDLVVGTIGELTALKGQEEFLKAASLILEQFPNVRFVIAGVDHSSGKKYQKQLEQLIKDLDLSDRVRLVGWVENLAQIYCGLDVFVSASRTESFGLVLAEAMATGTPVVATATEGAQELVTNNETGLVVPVGDVEQLAAAILCLLTETKLRTRLASSASLVAAQNFTIERMVDETEKIYQEVLSTEY